MSSGARIGLVVAAIVVVVVAFIVVSPGGDDKPKTSGASTATTGGGSAMTTPDETARTGGVSPTTTGEAPAFQTIRVAGGKPVGGIKKLTFNQGDRVRIEVTSPDTTDEIHLHGYDLARDLKAGGRVRFSFAAKIEGIFEIELEGSGVQIGKLVVEP
jgi:heme/copper-type cytochrome/quinol oxidase subunit 2